MDIVRGDEFMCVDCLVLSSNGGTRPSYARLPHVQGRSSATTRVGDCSPTQSSDGDSLTNVDEARRGTNCV